MGQVPDAGDPDRFRRVKAVFEELAALEESERAEALDRLRHDEPAVAREVRALLAVADVADELDAPALGEGFSLPAVAVGPLALEHGEGIGPYRILGVIGAGANGVVYRARHRDRVRDVAVKVLRPSVLTKESRRRFETELEVLASIAHPGLVALLDRGECSGAEVPRPYLVMELVAGLELTDHLRESGGGPREAVELIRQLCEVVHHLHGCGVLHRDIKPENILVEPSGHLKLLDLGLASLMSSAGTGDRGPPAGSLPYLAPELLRGEAEAGVRTDVHAIGVVAYEILAGRLPVDIAGLDRGEALRRLRRPVHIALARSCPAARGDLATIVERALESDPRRRFPSAAAFAAECERWLDGTPVLSTPASRSRRAMRMVARHRRLALGIGSAFALLLLLLLGTLRSLQLVDRARAEEARARALAEERVLEARAARRAAEESEERARSVLEHFTRILQSARGRASLAEAFEESAQTLETEFASDPLARSQLAHAYGSLLWWLSRPQLASELMDQAHAELTELLGAEAPQTLAVALDRLLLRTEGAASREVEGELRTLLSKLAASEAPRQEIARCRLQLARNLFERGMFDEAMEEAHRAEMGLDAWPVLRLAALNQRARCLAELARPKEAERLYREGLRLAEAAGLVRRSAWLTITNNLATSMQRSGRVAEASRLVEQVYEVRRERHGEEHPATLQAAHNLASLLLDQQRLEPATALAERTWRRRVKVLGRRDPAAIGTHRLVATCWWRAGRSTEGERAYREALDDLRAVLPADHVTIAEYRIILGQLYFGEGRTADALSQWEEAYGIFSRSLGRENTRARRLAAQVAQFLDRRGLDGEAERWRDRGVGR